MRLGINSRLVFKQGHCSFQDARGNIETVNDRTACNRPDARIDRHTADAFADHLRRALGCKIEVTHGVNLFAFVFRSDLTSPRDWVCETFEVEPPGGDFDLHAFINAEGVKVIQWVLETLFQKNFAYEMLGRKRRWIAPPKLPSYAPLRMPYDTTGITGVLNALHEEKPLPIPTTGDGKDKKGKRK